MEPGANRVRVEVVDGYGQAGAPAEVAVAVDREAPTLSLQLTSTWIAPEATFAASLSEPGCTLRVGELSWTVDGTAGSVTVPYAALEEHRGFSVEDPAGNRAESALPFWLVRDEADLRQALDEAAAGSQIFLGPGDYTMTDVLGDSKAVARLRRPVVLSGAGPLPEDRIQVDLSDFDAAKETFQGGVLEAQSEVPRLVFDGPKGLWFEAGADDGPFVLRGLQIERPALIEGAGSETNPTLIAASGRLRIEGAGSTPRRSA